VSVEIVTRRTEKGATYWYIEEKGKRIAQCKRRRDAVRVAQALDTLISHEEVAAAERAEERLREARADAQQQAVDAGNAVRESGLVIAQKEDRPK